MRTEYIPIFVQFDSLFHFDSYADLDAVPTIPLSLVGNPYFESEFGVDAIQTVAASFQQLEYFDSALNMDVLTTSALSPTALDYFSGNANITTVGIHDANFNELTHYEAQFGLIVFDLAELNINSTSYFGYEMSLEQVTYHAISLENSMAYTMSTDVTTVGIYEIGFTQTNMFTSFLEIVPVYIYMLEFDNIAYTVASTLCLDKVEHYHAVTISLQNRLEPNLSLDSTELIEESYIITSHFDFEIEMSCFTASQIAVFTEMQMSQNLDIDLVLGHPALNVNSNILHFSSNATLDYTTHTYLAFDSRTLGITGSVATMFLMRDRYLNDEEFFDLSIESFEDLTIENLLEVEI
jgi:hypothetical protein